METFDELKEKILRKNGKFVDMNFPASKKSLGELKAVDDVVWKRPHVSLLLNELVLLVHMK